MARKLTNPLPPASAVLQVPNLYVGTSGWAYPTWKPGFYPEKTPARRFLEFYSSRLPSVEVNYTFRTLPTPKMLADWLAATPPSFRFSFKAPQRITHFSRLRECSALLSEFVGALEPVWESGRLGLLLFQLPPNFKADGETRERLRGLLAEPVLAGYRVAFEFRHESWFTEETYGILRKGNAALCVAESDELVTPEVHTAATHTCFRLRRSGGYSQRALKAITAKLIGLATERDVFAYLKHEDEPTGALNACALLAAARKC